MEIIIKNDSDVKITIRKDETTISTIVCEDKKSSSIVQTCDGSHVKVN